MLGDSRGLGNGVDGAALLLDQKAFHGLFCALTQKAEEIIHFVDFAAKADGDDAVNIRIGGQADEYVTRSPEVSGGLAAAVLVHKAHGAVKISCRDSGGFRGAAHRGHDENVVADAHASVGSAVSQKFHFPPPY